MAKNNSLPIYRGGVYSLRPPALSKLITTSVMTPEGPVETVGEYAPSTMSHVRVISIEKPKTSDKAEGAFVTAFVQLNSGARLVSFFDDHVLEAKGVKKDDLVDLHGFNMGQKGRGFRVTYCHNYGHVSKMYQLPSQTPSKAAPATQPAAEAGEASATPASAE